MGPVLLFAHDLEVVRRSETRVTLRLGAWPVAVDADVADELLALRGAFAELVQRCIGEPPTAEVYEATEALSRVFSDHAPVSAALFDDDDGDGDEGEQE